MRGPFTRSKANNSGDLRHDWSSAAEVLKLEADNVQRPNFFEASWAPVVGVHENRIGNMVVLANR